MFTRKLGRSGIEVSAVGFGCWPIGGDILEFGKPVGWGTVDDEASIRAVQRAIDLGVTFFDTAEVYGRSEDILGRAFEGRREKVVIATKFGRQYDRERHDIGANEVTPTAMRRSLEGSLRRLKTDYIDLYQLHAWDCPAEEALTVREELEKVVIEGKIRAYGWSTDRIENARLFEAGEHCTAIQQSLNLFDGNEELLRLCEERDLASINRAPLAMGLLTGKYNQGTTLSTEDVRGAGHAWVRFFPDGMPNREMLRRIAAVREVLTSGGRTMAQGALAWLWGRSPNTIPIPGFKGTAQAEDNARAMEFGALTSEQMEQISEILQGEDAAETKGQASSK
ncbi:MAG: aldo/keto reductase [Anaerolineae bacterium]|nr:aldo/keto reductase [Anaerolineae bacterium]